MKTIAWNELILSFCFGNLAVIIQGLVETSQTCESYESCKRKLIKEQNGDAGEMTYFQIQER